MKRHELKTWDERLKALSAHDGPAAAEHVPAHALDRQRVKVLYPPELFTAW